MEPEIVNDLNSFKILQAQLFLVHKSAIHRGFNQKIRIRKDFPLLKTPTKNSIIIFTRYAFGIFILRSEIDKIDNFFDNYSENKNTTPLFDLGSLRDALLGEDFANQYYKLEKLIKELK
jgi:hypothetical protein